ncbi:type I-F CRISPR-associated protein Csy3 [Agarilytica rhodophyticola]|uniref:type I-F CRISPR-associated protein Csy3 n=1 Tax=Agarilytica rhodophyticola TaxID=1737490 RepID=UPI000B34254B|nr:type I-F CRISPR-associated protein Csy3 [Agarilytica rhodophyticola]
MKDNIELPNMLAFERKIEVSDGLMMSGNWTSSLLSGADENTWQNIAITQRKNRSTQSAYGISDEDKSKPNPVSSDNDDANLYPQHDTLKITFTARMIGDLGNPFGCNDPVFSSAIKDKVNTYKEEGLRELAYRYAYNLASGRFLWRNRVGAEFISIQIRVNNGEVIVFDGYDFSLKDFSMQRDNQDLAKVSSAIFDGLNSDDSFSCLNVNAYVKLAKGQHVFPSQEMNMQEKKKVLFKLNDCAALHSVKLGNAIRTIDDWYGSEKEPAEFPIAVEPFGAVTQRGQAYRKTKIDLYSLMLNWVNDKDISSDQQNFVLANLIRGGVFGGKN